MGIQKKQQAEAGKRMKMSKKPGGRLTVMVMLFYFTAFLLLALRNAVWQGYALALCVPAAIWGGTHVLGKCFHIDTLLFSLTNFLCALGILILYDTNPVLAYHQVVYYGVGLVGMVICIYFMRAFRTIRHLGFVMIAVSFAFLALPLLIGRETYGAKNWIYFHGVSIQPSEFVKILLILILAWFMSRRQFIPWFLCAVGCLLFLMLQKDLGTALLYYGVSLLLFFASTANLPLTLLGLLGGGGAAVMGYRMFAHVKKRVAIWRNPWSDYENAGYQIVQSLMALASGSLLGVGLGLGSPTTIPVYETDFIFSVIGEELGFVGSVLRSLRTADLCGGHLAGNHHCHGLKTQLSGACSHGSHDDDRSSDVYHYWWCDQADSADRHHHAVCLIGWVITGFQYVSDRADSGCGKPQ